MASFSFFVDKLSAETRVLIYSFLFSASSEYVMRPLSKEEIGAQYQEKGTRARLYDLPSVKPVGVGLLPTSIFSVNRQISDEALETFYNLKTVRLRFEQLDDDIGSGYLSFIRRVEIFDCAKTARERTFKEMKELVRGTLFSAATLPRMKSVVILSNDLARPDDDGISRSVRGFFQTYLMLGRLVCLDIGIFMLESDVGNFVIVNSRITKMWKSVKTAPPDFDGVAQAHLVIESWNLTPQLHDEAHANLIAYAAHTSLPIWVGLYQSMLEHTANGWATPDLDDEDGWRRWEATAQFGNTLKESKSYATDRQKQRLMVDGVPALQRLGPGGSPAALEAFTEILAANIEVFVGWTNLTDPETSQQIAQPCWQQLEDGESHAAALISLATIERAATKSKRSETHLQHPLDKDSWVEADQVRSNLMSEPEIMVLLGIGVSTVQLANVEDLQKIVYLVFALGIWEFPPANNNYNFPIISIELWARGLLEQYVYFILRDHTEDELRGSMILAELRGTFFEITKQIGFHIVEVENTPGAFPSSIDDTMVQGATETRENAAPDLYWPLVDRAERAIQAAMKTSEVVRWYGATNKASEQPNLALDEEQLRYEMPGSLSEGQSEPEESGDRKQESEVEMRCIVS